jgi:phosphate starvation-inducible PhoH-like protein
MSHTPTPQKPSDSSAKAAHGTDTPSPDKTSGDKSGALVFDDTAKLIDLFGEHDCHLARIETAFDVSLMPRGNQVEIEGKSAPRKQAGRVLRDLYARLEQGLDVSLADVDGAIRLVKGGSPDATSLDPNLQIRTPRKIVSPRSPTQADYITALKTSDLTFGVGPAGTGKTYLAVAAAVARLAEGKIDRIILSRPAVEAGERLGFLPGDLRDKVDPYLRPLYDALYDTFSAEQVEKRLETGEIEVAPLAYMRGRTLSNAFIILDEAQNTTHVQMKMFLTRMGEGSQMVVTGDPTQIDLPHSVPSGLLEAEKILKNVAGASFTYFTDADVVRHPLVSRIVRAYNRYEDEKRPSRTGAPESSTPQTSRRPAR